jgi:uncharacterized protein (TIGR02588 family)
VTPKAAAKDARIPRAEWAVAALSAVLVLGTIAWLAVHAVRPAADPEFAVSVDTITAREGGWTVRVRVENRGDRAAAAVEVEGAIEGGEVSGFTLDFLAGGSARHGALRFRGDPRPAALTLRVRGYADP